MSKYYTKIALRISLAAILILIPVGYGISYALELTSAVRQDNTGESGATADALGRSLNADLIIPGIPDPQGFGRVECRHVRITEDDTQRDVVLGLPLFRAWSPAAETAIREYISRYSGLIKNVRLYTDGKDFIVLISLNTDDQENNKYIRTSGIFTDFIGNTSRMLLKVIAAELERSGISNKDELLNLKQSQLAVFWTILDCISKRAPDIFHIYFSRGVEVDIKEFSNWVGGGRKGSIFLNQGVVFGRELEIITQYVTQNRQLFILDKTQVNVLDVNIYDVGAGRGTFSAVAANYLDDWAKGNRVLLRARFHIVDPDRTMFEKFGRQAYNDLAGIYKTAAGQQGLNFSYAVSDSGHAEKEMYERNSIVVANQFYEHIPLSVRDAIVKSLASCGIALHLINVPYEAVPDAAWGHISRFDHGQMQRFVSLFNGGSSSRYSDTIEDEENNGLLVIKKR